MGFFQFNFFLNLEAVNLRLWCSPRRSGFWTPLVTKTMHAKCSCHLSLKKWVEKKSLCSSESLLRMTWVQISPTVSGFWILDFDVLMKCVIIICIPADLGPHNYLNLSHTYKNIRFFSTNSCLGDPRHDSMTGLQYLNKQEDWQVITVWPQIFIPALHAIA